MYGSHWAGKKKRVFRQLLTWATRIVVKPINPYSAIVVFGLQVYGPDHIHPDQTLLGSTVRELSELTWRSSNTGVIWQRVHFKGALMGDKSVCIWFQFMEACKHQNITFSSPTTVGSSSPFSFLPRCSLNVLQKSVSPLNSTIFSSSESYTWEHTLAFNPGEASVHCATVMNTFTLCLPVKASCANKESLL